MSKSHRLFASVLLLTLTGCAGPIAQRVATDPKVMIADHLLVQGDYESALRSYQELVQSSKYPDYFRLKATDAALRAGQGKTAQWLADTINPDELDSIDRDQLLLLKSRLDLSQGKARDAMAKLGSIRLDKLDPPHLAHFYTLKASAWNQLGNMLESAKASIAASRFMNRPEDVQHTYTTLYDALSKLPPDVLANRQPTPPDVLSGWMELVRIVGQDNPAKVATTLAEWRKRFPGHPADGAFLQSLEQTRAAPVEVSPLESAPATAVPSRSALPVRSGSSASSYIGVLLPLTGTYAEASAAIRAGLDAAYEADTNPEKLPLQFVDTQSGDITALYQQLVGAGASAILGPLTKENLTSLAQSSNLSVPVMALNQVATAQHDKIYQLGLNPEQEVEQVAASAWFDGRRSALILSPSSNFGQRITHHFSNYWKQIGGNLLATETYPYHGEDFSQPVKNLLASSTPTARASFIYLIADARDAHLLVPQILSQSGNTAPIYATSQVFAGKMDPANDQALNGVVFCDLPWSLDRNEGGPLSADNLSGAIQNTKTDYVKLIALGVDAYHLLPELEALRQDTQYRYPGLTGTLSLRNGNRFERQMSCAQFQNGNLEMRGTAPILPASGVPH